MMNFSLQENMEVSLSLKRGNRTYSVKELIAMAEQYEAEQDARRAEEDSVPTRILVRGVKTKVEFSKIDWSIIEAPRDQNAYNEKDCQSRMLAARACAEQNMAKYGEFELELPEPLYGSWNSFTWKEVKRLVREKATCEADWASMFLLFAQFISNNKGKYSNKIAWKIVCDRPLPLEEPCWIVTCKEGKYTKADDGIYMGGYGDENSAISPATLTAVCRDEELIAFAEPIFGYYYNTNQ